MMLELLTTLRRAAGVSQVELSKRIEKDQPFISNVENGVRRIDVIEFYAIVTELGGDPAAAFADLCRGLPRQVSI